MGFEIERKFLVKALPTDLERFPYHEIIQGYLCRHPAIRVRKEDEHYYMTYKGLREAGALSQEEYNLMLTKEAYEHLLAKADGTVIEKRRYLIPDGAYTIELDVFRGAFQGLVIAEVEFPTEQEAKAYIGPSWFLDEVTGDEHYSNAHLAFSGEAVL